MRLHTVDGARKYLTAGERDAFLRQAELADRQVRTLCMTLAYAGCRLSEALALTADRVDLAAGVLVIESLKKRRTGISAVPRLALESRSLPSAAATVASNLAMWRRGNLASRKTAMRQPANAAIQQFCWRKKSSSDNCWQKGNATCWQV